MRKAKRLQMVKEQILKICPNAKSIEVKVEQEENGGFVSMIKVHIPSKKILLAEKRSDVYKKSLDQSLQAIQRQVRKVKTRWDKNRQNRRLNTLQFVL